MSTAWVAKRVEVRLGAGPIPFHSSTSDPQRKLGRTPSAVESPHTKDVGLVRGEVRAAEESETNSSRGNPWLVAFPDK